MLQYDFDWTFVTRSQFVELLVDGTVRTIALAVVSGTLSFVLGALVAMARLWPSAWVRMPANGAVEIVLGERQARPLRLDDCRLVGDRKPTRPAGNTRNTAHDGHALPHWYHGRTRAPVRRHLAG